MLMARLSSVFDGDGTRQGIILGLVAYTIWGFFPIYFKALSELSPLEIVCHRISWSAASLLALVFIRRKFRSLIDIFLNRKILLTLCCSTLLVATNWLVFVFAVESGEVLQASLGYFINPLVSVLLGFIFLHEQLRPWQQVSIFLALVGVLNLTIQVGLIPWISLILAGTFGLYGLLRKIAPVEALVGLAVETLLLSPIAMGYLIFLSIQHQGHFLSGSIRLNILLPFIGVLGSTPLLCFVGAARRLRLSVVGFLQYITPSMQFILAVGLYSEHFSKYHLVSFIFIWTGLIVFSADSIFKKGNG